MQINESIAIIESILFACGEPVDTQRISRASGVEPETVHKLIQLLSDRYEENHSALRIVKLEDSYQLCTKSDYADYIKSAMETKRSVPLSAAAMETLAIIAYNQPVSKSFIENVRGTDSSSVVNSLVEKGLLCEAGRLDVPGKPIAYQTTANFLRCFGLSSIENLPLLPDSSGQVSFEELETNINEINE